MPGLTDSTQTVYDLLVVGLGPAGIACLSQACRDGLVAVGVGDEPAGGLLPAARRLDNLPGFSPVSGARLAGQLAAHLERLPATTLAGRVTWLERHQGVFRASLEGMETPLCARAAVLAVGTEPRPWNAAVEGPVHRDVRTLPGDLAGERVLVIGSGEAALDSALTCRDRGATVQLLARGKVLRATERLIEESRGAGVEHHFGVTPRRLARHAGRWQVRTEDGRAFAARHLLVCIGRRPRRRLLQAVGGRTGRDVTARGVAGLFLAGDLIRGRERYVATALGDGQRAALAAAAYLRREEER